MCYYGNACTTKSKGPRSKQIILRIFLCNNPSEAQENSWRIPLHIRFQLPKVQNLTNLSKKVVLPFFLLGLHVCLKSCLSVWIKKCWKSYPTNSELHVLSLIEAGCWLLWREIEWSTKHVKCICASKLDSQSWNSPKGLWTKNWKNYRWCKCVHIYVMYTLYNNVILNIDIWWFIFTSIGRHVVFKGPPIEGTPFFFAPTLTESSPPISRKIPPESGKSSWNLKIKNTSIKNL